MPIKKKTVKTRAAVNKKPTAVLKIKKEKPVGVVTHFYGGIKVAIVKFSKPIALGATVSFRGATTDFTQKIVSLQFDHKDIAKAPKGKEVGMKVGKRVREGDEVFAA